MYVVTFHQSFILIIRIIRTILIMIVIIIIIVVVYLCAFRLMNGTLVLFLPKS